MPGVSQETHRQKKAIVGTSSSKYANKTGNCTKRTREKVFEEKAKLLDTYTIISCSIRLNISLGNVLCLDAELLAILICELLTEKSLVDLPV
jgi:hypothetical protein